MQALSKNWAPVHKAERILEIDRKDLHRMRDNGTFKLGRHYGAGPLTRSRDTYYWNIPLVKNRLLELEKQKVMQLKKTSQVPSDNRLTA
jgi:hypothetical protein